MTELATAPAGTLAGADRQARPHRAMHRYARWAPIVFVAPVVIYMLLFFVYPLVFGVIMSLENFGFEAIIKGSGPFVGLQNYRSALSNSATLRAIPNTALFTVISIVFQFSIGMGMALILNKKFPLRGLFRALILIPWLLPLLASGTVFELIFQAKNGLANAALTQLGIIHHPIYWLVNPLSAFFAVVLVNIWAGIPFNTLVLYSGLQDVPAELHEAALVDGANVFQRFFHVTIPSMRPVILIVLMLGIIYTVKTFDIVIVMTDGGPGNATQLLSTWAYNQGFSSFFFGQATAIGNILLVFCLIIAVFYVRLSKRMIDA